MKKIMIFLLFCGQIARAQETVFKDVMYTNHEIKINALYVVLGIIDVNYDYILNEKSSIGCSVAVAFDKEVEFRNIFLANYRYYFGLDYAAGFYIETFATINTIEDYPTFILGGLFGEEKIKETNLGLGAAIGSKFVLKNGLLLDVYAGIGRNFSNTYTFQFIPRLGISLGKRF